MNKVETFINDMKKLFPAEMEMIFYHGYCYWFAFILAEGFKGEIWFNPTIVHFAAKIGDSLYDIFGEVEPGVNPFTGVYNRSNDDWYSWENYQTNHYDVVESIVDSCIKKEGGTN